MPDKELETDLRLAIQELRIAELGNAITIITEAVVSRVLKANPIYSEVIAHNMNSRRLLLAASLKVIAQELTSIADSNIVKG